MEINEPKISLIVFITLLVSILGVGLAIFIVLNVEPKIEPLGANQLSTDAEKIEQIDSNIQTIQDDYKSSNPKYQHVLKTTDLDTGLDYSVTEYETSKGEVGYQVIFYNNQGQIIESIGYGVEANNRTFTRTYPPYIPFVTST